MKIATFLLVLLFAVGIGFAQEIPREGLVGYWKMDEGDGTVTADSSEFSADGVIEGASFWVDGYMGQALELDGIDGYVNCGVGEGQFEIEDALTLSVWVNQSDLGNSEHNPWLGKGDHSYQIKHQRGNNYRMIVYTDDWYSASVPVDPSHAFEWHHIAGTYDQEYIRLYVDGVLADSLQHDQLIALSDHPVCMAWNADESAADRFFAGQLDEAMIYNVALTNDQIKQLYDVKSDVMQKRTLANEFRLQQNYPNPFNPVTTIRYELPQNAHVRLTIYDVLGREVVRLVDEGYLAGAYSVVWNGTNRYGVPVASGIYIYRLEAGRNFVQSRKMLLLK